MEAGGFFAGADEAAISSQIVQMEHDFFQLGGSYQSLSTSTRFWGTTGWVAGKPVISLAGDASYGTLVEELYHVQQIKAFRIGYFQRFGTMPTTDIVNWAILSQQTAWEEQAGQFVCDLGFDRLTIGE